MTRGPYLQLGTEDGVVVRWRTDAAVESCVDYGTVLGSLDTNVCDLAPTGEHEVAITGLDPNTRYFYAIGTQSARLAGDDADHYFTTSPPVGVARPTRIWVAGDSGTAHQRRVNPSSGEQRDAQGVRDSYLSYSGLGSALVTSRAVWKYLADGSDQGTAWRAPAFDDTGWSSGPAQLGYGDGDEATVINCGPNPPNCSSGKFITSYFRHSFEVADASAFEMLTLAVQRDDGAVAYLNGVEVFRANMPAGAIDSTTLAPTTVGSTDELRFFRATVDASLLVDGTNVLAVEIHQRGTTSSDVSFDLELFGRTPAGTATNVWLMLGDNAYSVGSDNEWQQAVFDAYAVLLRNTVLWPALGNHDISTLDGQPQLDAMTLPTNAEAGGLASGTEEYFSFDYGNIHFVVLDSTHSASRAAGSAMLTWLASDLAGTSRDWIITIWHHAPYTKGTHDSDTAADSTQMRENVIPVLEAGGVDLVLTGHSHVYERSFLIDGFYATPTTILDGTIVDGGDGCVSTGCDGPYVKPTPGPAAFEGAIYAVVGSSGKNNPGSGTPNHPLMHFSANELGSMVIDVEDRRLDATFINRDCAGENDEACVLDSFTIVKGDIQPVYLELSSPVESVARGESLPFTLEQENITTTGQAYFMVWIVDRPVGPNVRLLVKRTGLAPLSARTWDGALPIPATVRVGTWKLFAVAWRPGAGIIDVEKIQFTVE